MKQIIFLISAPRSGSTLLQKLLVTSEKINTAAEPWWLLPLLRYKSNQGYESYNKRIASKAIQDFDAYFNKATGSSLDSEIAKMVQEAYCLLAPDGGYFLDKTPRYYLIVDELRELFPQAKFIFLTRNPLEILASKLSSHNGTFHAYYKYKIDLYQSVKSITNSLHTREDNIFHLDYNELISSESNCVKQLKSFLQLDDIDSKKINQVEVNGRMGDPKAMTQNEGIRSEKSFWYNTIDSPIKYLVFKKIFSAIPDDYFHFSETSKSSVKNDFKKISWLAYVNFWQGTIDGLALIRSYLTKHSK
ncbi:sulfotransferase [Schleiferiaceae bacterium]|nr:sulfotransferase [Schleiferiaceae bacterium]